MTQTPLRAGIIAAGDGTRLKPLHPDLPKPLVPVGDRPLIDWVVGSLEAAGIRSIVVLLNSRGRAVRQHLKSGFPKVQWTFLEKDTRSSWESFRLVSRALGGTSSRFLISTADAIASAEEMLRFAREASVSMQSGDAGVLALTRFVEDEKPLWANVDKSGRIRALGDSAKDSGWVTSGFYGLTRELADAMPAPEAHARLRDYWISLIAGGHRIHGAELSKTVDVDRPEDIATAAAFVAALGGSR